MNPTPSMVAARQLREQDLAAHEAMRHAKPQTLAAAHAIRDIGQMHPADAATLFNEIQRSIERHGLYIARKSVLAGLEDMQQECAGAMRQEAERDAQWEKQ